MNRILSLEDYEIDALVTDAPLDSIKRKAQEAARISTPCPACGNRTLAVHNGYLLCTFRECPSPSVSDTIDTIYKGLDKIADTLVSVSDGNIEIRRMVDELNRSAVD